jgi:flavin-dependent dehydrogenase
VATIVSTARDYWDVIVVGAGPAGSVAASMLAEGGRRVLLVERGQWPREKACGGCLNALAVGILKRVGLGSALRGGREIDRAVWRAGRQAIEVDAPGGVAILRSQFDSNLVGCAVERGCTFISGRCARLLRQESQADYRTVQLKGGAQNETVRTKMVLACDGINGTLLNGEAWGQWRVGRGAWMGVSTTYPGAMGEVAGGAIWMDVGHGGYVGRVRLREGLVHLAAAIDPKACRGAGGPARLIQNILQSNGSDGDVKEARLNATGLLTRRRSRLGGHRVLAVGDACGYVEPFTGEGMGWAILGARGVAEMLLGNGRWSGDLPRRWEERYRELVERRQRWCRWMRPMMHHPMLAGLGIALGRAIPPAGVYLSRAVTA